jgi:hypothetical protein
MDPVAFTMTGLLLKRCVGVQPSRTEGLQLLEDAVNDTIMNNASDPFP